MERADRTAPRRDQHGTGHRPRPAVLDNAGDDRGFAAWLLVADLTCRRSYALSIFDLADWAWRMAYDDDQTPKAALQDALAADDIGALLLGGG